MEGKQNINYPILVTGMHRSGTTWVGKNLALSPNSLYVSEPLNLNRRPGFLTAPIQKWYTYICNDNNALFYPSFSDLLSYKMNLRKELLDPKSAKIFIKILKSYFQLKAAGLKKSRIIIKDPFAVFSIPWFINKFNTKVVVSVRSPLAVVSSLKRLGWGFDPKFLLSQNLLMTDLLSPYEGEIKKLLEKNADVIYQGSLLWKLIYQTAWDYSKQYSQNIIMVRHEDLSLDAPKGFRDLYRSLDSSFSQNIANQIELSSGKNNAKEIPLEKPHQVNVDSKSNISSWKNRLTDDEVKIITDITSGTASLYYPEGLGK